MDRFVPIGKRSKREQRDYYALMRKDWGNTNPRTRIVEDSHKSKRERERAREMLMDTP